MKLNQESASTSIYLQQIQNQIDLGEGYNKIRKMLFKQLHMCDGPNPVSDDKLAETIVIKLANGLNTYVKFHQAQKIFRSLQVCLQGMKIVSDLLTYCETIMTQTMHTQLFVNALANVSLPSILTFNARLDMQNRDVALGIFSFWFQTYGREQTDKYELFLEKYQFLVGKKMKMPPPTIVPVEYKPQQKTQKQKETTQLPNANSIILQDTDQFTIKTQNDLTESIKKIATTQYVRLIKHKSKVLYQFTQKGSSLSDKQKNKVKDLYKRLRNVLKEIDKYNQKKIGQTAANSQSSYVQQKMSPKKKQKGEQNSIGDQKNNQSEDKDTKKPSASIDLLDLDVSTPKKEEEVKKEEVAVQVKKPIDLLDFDTEQPQQKPKPPKNINQIQFADLLSDIKPEPQHTLSQKKQSQNSIEQNIFTPNLHTSQKQNSLKQLEKNSLKQLEKVYSTPSKHNSSPDDDHHLAQKQRSNQSRSSNPDFNNLDAKDKYAIIPNAINLSPHSSNSDSPPPQSKDGMKFDLFGLFGNKQENIPQAQNLYDDKKPYDDYPPPLAPKKQLSHSSQYSASGNPSNSQGISLLDSPSRPQSPLKMVRPIDYSQYAIQKSPSKSQQDQDQHFQPNKAFEHLEQANLPEQSSTKNKKGNSLLDQDD